MDVELKHQLPNFLRDDQNQHLEPVFLMYGMTSKCSGIYQGLL